MAAQVEVEAECDALRAQHAEELCEAKRLELEAAAQLRAELEGAAQLLAQGHETHA